MDFEQPRALEQIIREPDKSFWWLTATHFLGEMNDKYFKLIGLFFITSLWGKERAGIATAIGAMLFVLPFLVLAPIAGLLADRVSKRNVIASAMAGEIAIMTCGCIAVFTNNVFLIFSAVLFKGIQCAIFRPSKYGIVPELVAVDELSSANSFLESSTYVAFICGTGLSFLLPSVAKGSYVLPSLACPLLALAGLAASLQIRRTEPAEKGKSATTLSMADVRETFLCIVKDRYMLLAVLGTAYFMMIAAFAQMNLYPFGMQVFLLTKEESGLLFLLAATGIAAGSLLTGKLSGRNIEIGLIPAGALILTLGVLGLGFPSENIVASLSSIILFGLGAGLFIVPIYAFIQLRSPREFLGKILAVSSFLSWFGVLLAGGLVFVLHKFLALSAQQSFAVLGALTLALTGITLTVLPDFFVRTIGLLVTNFFYRLKVIGFENLPAKGPGLLIPNHVTWADALFLLATGTRHIRFAMDRRICEGKLSPLFKLMGVIPISMDDSSQAIDQAFEQIEKTLEDGHLVCVFTEGGGEAGGGFMDQYKDAFKKIICSGNFPVIPVYIGGAWGSIFSYAHGSPLSRLPHGIPYPVTIVFGKPLPPGFKAAEIRQAVSELSCLYFEDKKPRRRTVIEYFASMAKRKQSLPAMADSTGKRLSYGQALTSALALAELLRAELGDAEIVGIILPTSVDGALVNLAVSLLGKVPVNLDVSDLTASIQNAVEKCGAQRIVTSRKIFDNAERTAKSAKPVFLEDLSNRLTGRVKLAAWLRARFFFPAKLCREAAQRTGGAAAMAFFSGKANGPKAVMLSHHNIVSNVEALGAACGTSSRDKLFAALPFSHPQGLACSLWLPLLSGIPVVFHGDLGGLGDPGEADKAAKAVKKHKSSIFLSTPAVLGDYVVKAEKNDLASLRMVVTVGGKLKAKLADEFEAKFGVRPVESYGAPELTATAALNIPDIGAGADVPQKLKAGSEGRPIPGVAVKIVDPENLEPLPPGSSGIILVKGPNVSMGYYNVAEKTSRDVKDGWLVTGDTGKIDEDGFLWVNEEFAGT